MKSECHKPLVSATNHYSQCHQPLQSVSSTTTGSLSNKTLQYGTPTVAVHQISPVSVTGHLMCKMAN